MYIMSKARSMYAGSSGSNYGVNKNSPGNGNGKWQGLWPSVGHARNTRYINTRAGGDNRDVVFCMNQLGGIGRKSNMFATTADGVKEPCPGADNKPWWFNNPAILAALRTVRDYIINNQILNSNPGTFSGVVFIGDHETLKTDHVSSHTGHDDTDPSWLFELLQPTTSSLNVNQAIELLNSMKLQLDVNGKMQLHEVGIVGEKAAEALMKNGYNHPFLIGDSNAVVAFGDSKPCSQNGWDIQKTAVWTGDNLPSYVDGASIFGSYAVSDGGLGHRCAWNLNCDKQCHSCKAVTCNPFNPFGYCGMVCNDCPRPC